MLIVGERINTFKKRVMRAYEEKDVEFIRQEALRQAEAGAQVIDVNAGSDIDVEPDNMKWAVRSIQEAVDLPLCIDSPNPATIQAGFEVCKDKQAAWANSITLEKERVDNILPLVKEHQCPVIALCRDESGVAQSAQERVEVGKKIVDAIDRYGIALEKLYLDPMIEPLSVRSDGGMMSVHTLLGLKRQLPEIKTIISLSGISFGLPERKLLHRSFMPMLMYAGLDAVFLDPLDTLLMQSVIASQALLDQDEFCMNYITASREGKLSS
jgi:5-methyltetrahydrofolate corrinoid/iron sulfur protein methyltransferase